MSWGAEEGLRLVRRPLDWDLSPIQGLRLMRADAHPVALMGNWAGGYDVIGSEPRLTRGTPRSLGDVFDSPCPPVTGGPASVDSAFGGGWIGYLGYGAAAGALPPAGARRLPAGWFGYYDHVVCRERASGRWYFEALWSPRRADGLERRFEELCRRAARPLPPPSGYSCGGFRLVPSAAGHKAAIRRAVEYIRQGDIFQANICLRAEADFAGDPVDAFCQAVTVLQPPFAAFLRIPGGAMASLSPELFLRRKDRTVLSRPIKGTGHRSARPDQASQQRSGLESSAKNRAENVMIVDLVRNDLSRVCAPGSVTVPRLLDAEPHPGLWHLVSEVRGTLSPRSGDGDLIRAAFPPGSVTGAPKVRALEIIGELEAAPREVYTGAIGYRSPVAGLELNVAIRTFEFAAGRAWLGVGGGIVADSAEDEEYAECLLKAGPLVHAIGSRLEPDAGAGAAATAGLLPLRPRPAAGVFTSLRVTAGETSGLAGHLARLEASTRQLYGKDLPASLAGDLADRLAQRPSGRLRIKARPVGGPLRATVEVVPSPPPPAAVSLHPVVIPGGLGAHKWHDRRLLAELAGRAALEPGTHLLITDTGGDVLETDKANIFAVRGGVLRTPPADGRILPGVTRDAVLQAARREGIATGTAPVSMDVLLGASEVFVTNSMYGVLPVRSLAGRAGSWEPGPVARHLAGMLPTRPVRSPARRPSNRSPAVSSPLRARTARTTTRPTIVLVDNYDSFTYNLVHMLATAGCRVEVVRNDEVPAGQIAASAPAGVVISPGPCAPADAGISIDVVRACAGQIPLLGICLGHQAIAAAFGASIVTAPRPVHGQVSEITHDSRGVLAGLPRRFHATRYHSLLVDEHSLPSALMITARAGQLPMALRHLSSPIEGVQFHPESVLTTHGETIIRNFIRAAEGRHGAD
jgi:para-aminobenzoate synthetase / 4-amino-4-deoxychorismate lyase